MVHKIDVYKKYIFDEMSKNKEYSIVDLESFVYSLNNEQAKQLCKYFSYYRRNNVYDFISKGPEVWQKGIVNISSIDVGMIHVGINHYLEENGWLLKNIAKDKRICSLEEFRDQGGIHPKSLSFIAKKEDHRYRIIDGMHRAIRLSCDNKDRFKLIYYIKE